MVAIIETVNSIANLFIFETFEEVERELIKRYNKRVKEVEKVDWKNTWIDIEKRFARVDNWEDIIEWRVGKLEKVN